MSINIWTDSMQHAELLGKPVLFTNWLIQRDIIPDGWYCYDLRGTHKSPSTRTTLVDHAADYHAGTVLSPIPLKHEGTASHRVNGTFYLLGEELTLEQFCEEHDLAYPQDNREFVLRPASLDEAGLFYSEEKLDEALGTVGHLRMDFGHGEKEFWHTWWPHNEDRFNTPEFKEVLQRFVDDLRQTGLLKNLGAMDAYLREEAGIPAGAKLCVYVDDEEKTVTIAEAGYDHDLRDVPPYLLEMLGEAGICLGELEERLMVGDLIYGERTTCNGQEEHGDE